MIFFRNGKCAKIPLSGFETKTKRKKLSAAYSSLSELVAMFVIPKETDFVLKSDAGKVLLFNSALVLPKAARDTQGVQVMRLSKGAQLMSAYLAEETKLKKSESYRIKTIPAAGIFTDDDIDQLRLI